MPYKKYKNIYCLFHEMTDCNCSTPVVDEKTLLERLEISIRVNEGLKDVEFNGEKLIEIEARIAGFQKRSDDLKFVG